MRNFLKLAQNVNILPLLHAVQTQPELWNADNLRTLYPDSPHAQADDIWLRFNDRALWESEPERIMDEPESVNYPAWNKLTQAHGIVFDLLRTVQGSRIGRVMLTRLAPGKNIAPHIDGGKYAAYYNRYHVFLQNLPGANFRAGEEVICPQAGDVYWFNNKIEHEVINHSTDDRITLIIDIRCEK